MLDPLPAMKWPTMTATAVRRNLPANEINFASRKWNGGDEQNRPRQHGNESGQYVRWNVGDNLGIDMCTLDDVLGGDSTCFLVTSRCYSHRLVVIEELISILFTFPQFLFSHYFATIIIQISSCNYVSCSKVENTLYVLLAFLVCLFCHNNCWQSTMY